MGSKPKVRRHPSAPRKKKAMAPPKEKPQRERFIEAARNVGVDESGKEFERLFDRVVRRGK
ncbi:MAG: hypothetical protein IT539_03880 [Bradyrhizobiaceae bacterium]|nr:hypothetical protein [Bradyrhizobiaceae bacterium]